MVRTKGPLLLSRRGLLATVAFAALAPAGVRARAEERGPPPLAEEFAEHFSVRKTPIPAVPVGFGAPDGETVTLESFRGKVVVLNFWATWCPPCVAEMASLDRLQAELGPEGVAVVTVSEDLAGERVVIPFLRQHGLANLDSYTDPKGYLAEALGVRGLPTTFLIDAAGLIVGGMEGPADWSGEAAKGLVRHYLPTERKSDAT